AHGQGLPHGGALRASLGAVLGAALPAVGASGRVERGADHLVANARQVLDAPASDQRDRVLLQVVPLARNVRGDLDAVRQPDAGSLAQSRVRLLRSDRVDARADAALLRSTEQRGRLGLALGRDASLAYELIYSGHETPGTGPLHDKGRRGRLPCQPARDGSKNGPAIRP